MSVSYRHSGQLPWSTLDRDERRFYLITTTVLLIALLLGLIVPMIDLPEKERFKKQSLPPRLARLILEQKQTPPPKPKPKKIVEEKKKEPERAENEKTGECCHRDGVRCDVCDCVYLFFTRAPCDKYCRPG